MILKLFPCIIKHRGSVTYFKHVLSFTRYKKTIPDKSAKVFAAAASHAQHPKRIDLSPQNKNEAKKEHSVEHFYQSTTFGTSDKSNTNVSNFCDKEAEVLLPLKGVSHPDVTSSISKTEESSQNADVKLLNTVNPADLDWQKQTFNIKLLPRYYKSLSKIKLTGLVVLTTMAGYGMAPGVFDPATLACLVLGTGLTSAAANTLNQVLEVPYDSQMARTKNRVLTCGLLTPLHATTFAAFSATAGFSILYLGASGTTAALGLINLVLYACLYTPLKRISIANTWVGSVVGSIPPLMGWAAASGGSLTAGALLMASILYSWQFPHFNALSWNLRTDYSRAGYRMTSVIDPALCRRVALRHSVALLVLCSSAPILNLTSWSFAIDSLPLNCYLIYCAWLFYKNGDNKSSRKLFRLSLVYLPLLMVLMLVGKKHSPKPKNKEIVSSS